MTEPGAKQLTVQRRLVAWDPDGNPVTRVVPMLPKQELQNIALAAMSLPYHDPVGLEPEFAGLTNAEVMYIKLAREAARTGDSSLIDKLTDRIVGKTKQVSESIQVKANYEDYIKKLAQEAAIPVRAEPVEAAAVEEPIDVAKVDVFA